jgi:hypothetical protein
MNKLDAVNAVLRRVGVLPVPALDTNGPSAAGHAERFLDAADRSLQARGWHFNTRREVTLTRNVSNKIAVPASTFHIDTDGSSRGLDVTVVGGFLYDLANNTDVWAQNLVVTYVAQAAFADLPEAFADYVVTDAAFQFNRFHKKDQSLDQMIRDELTVRWAALKRADRELADVNVLNTAESNQLRGRPRMRDRSVY